MRLPCLGRCACQLSLFLVLMFFQDRLMAAKLNPVDWQFLLVDNHPASPATAPGLGILTDNNLSTSLTNQQIGIDFGITNTLDRIYLSGTNRQLQLWPNWYTTGTNAPLGLVKAWVGNTWPPTNLAGWFTVPYDAGNPVDTEVDIRFSPLAGRYVLVAFQTNVTWGVNYWPGFGLASQPKVHANLNWRVAELEIYGFPGVYPPASAVVLATPAPAPLALAASDLSYYLGELTGRPVPIVTPSQTNAYPGSLFCVNDLKPLAPDYATMMANIQNGSLPANVNILTNGRAINFTSWPYRGVLWSVWEFLERQGVRWVYPDAQGDYVPKVAGLDLSFLPLHYTPSATSIYANWDLSSYQPWAPWDTQSLRQSYLFAWRNRWNQSWNGYGPLGGAEIPAASAPGQLNPDYQEQFSGYPENFDSVIPNRILVAKGSTWWGFDPSLGKRISPTQSGAPSFCMDNPAVIQWVAGKVVAVDTAYPIPSQHPLNIFHVDDAYNLLPMDATWYCQDPSWCAASNAPVNPNTGAYGTLYTNSMSGEYYSFVTGVARSVSAQGSSARIGALAYADVYDPPVNLPRFPDNVNVEVCMYGAPNLPGASSWNSGLLATWADWHSTCSHLATYDYALLQTGYQQPDPRFPVPLVSAIIDRAQFLGSIGALNGGCQASATSQPFNPWNFYAYPRIRWNTNQTSQTILDEFFRGCFREAAAPMEAYYQDYETYETTNNVSLHAGDSYGLTQGSFPVSLLENLHNDLHLAMATATNWVVADRINRIHDGLAMVRLARNLYYADLTDYSSYLPVLAILPQTIPLNRFTAPNLSHGNYVSLSTTPNQWTFAAQGTLLTTLVFPAGGNYRVTINARAVPFQNVYPVLDCYLGARGGSTTITSTNFQSYTYNLSVPAGAWDLQLDYENAAAGGARNVIINQIQILLQ